MSEFMAYMSEVLKYFKITIPNSTNVESVIKKSGVKTVERKQSYSPKKINRTTQIKQPIMRGRPTVNRSKSMD